MLSFCQSGTFRGHWLRRRGFSEGAGGLKHGRCLEFRTPAIAAFQPDSCGSDRVGSLSAIERRPGMMSVLGCKLGSCQCDGSRISLQNK